MTVFFCLRTTERRKDQIVAKQDAFRVITCIVYAQLLSGHNIVAQNKKTIASLGDRSSWTMNQDDPFGPTSSFGPIRSFRQTSSFGPIRSFGPTRSLKIARTVIEQLHYSKLLRRLDGNLTII